MRLKPQATPSDSLVQSPAYNPSGRSFSGWLGGKSQLARSIIDMIPTHNHYVELFSGAAWVLFKKQPSNIETINDANGELINLYRVFKYHFNALVEEFETVLISRDLFELWKKTDPATLTDVQRAARFYYLLRTCFGAKVDSQHFFSHVERNRHLKLGKDLRDNLTKIHERLQKVSIENRNFDVILTKFDRPETLFYLDPPYYNCEHYYGKDLFSRSDFERLRDILTNIKGKFILSLNDVPEVRELFGQFYLHEKQIRWSVNATAQSDENGKELIITNFKIPD